jgi:ubiquinone/menaquinone biosynthesis C-methylase UbiE
VNDSIKSSGSPDPNTIRASYDQASEDYDQSRLRTAFQRRFDATERAVLRRYLSKCDSALEVGVGTGRLTNELLERAGTVTAVDISEKMLEKVRAKYLDAKNLNLRSVDAHALDRIPGYGSFDAVVSMRMLPHIEDIIGVLQLLRDAAKPSGTVIVDFWNRHSYVHWRKRRSSVYNHYVTYSEAVEMIRLSGLQLVSIEGAGFQNPLNLDLEFMGRTALKRIAYSLIAICRRPGQ